ncbi:uncharacterized protein LOC144143064 [Haemaphysalis longicornis]
MVQETHTEDAPSLTGYRAHASPPSARDCGKGAAQGVCTFVKKGIPFVKHEGLLGRSALEYCATEVVLGKKKKESILLVNVYSNPAHRQQRFRTILHTALATAPRDTIAICGDFNAPHKELGYTRTTLKGKKLLDEAADAGFTLHTDPSSPTRIGTSVTRDTNPDLAFVRVANSVRGGAKWRNTGQNMGSDHFVIEIELPTTARPRDERRRQQKITDWNLFRARAEEESTQDIAEIESWTEDIVRLITDATTELETDEEHPGIDSRLANMLEARQSLQKRWRGRINNHRLRKRIATLGREIEKYSRELCTQRWHAVCNEADGQLHKGRTWRLLRHLLDETGTKGYQQHRLAQVVHTTTKALGREETCRRIDAKYLQSTPSESHGEYAGADNPVLDRDIEEWEVRAVLQTINCKSAAGPDRVTNKALRNLGDGAIASLTRYFNRCWRAGALPRQWKTARTVLIPKPGKPPNIKNLRPISLTSCRLSTQDAMIQLQHDILDTSVRTQDNRAVLGLDLKSAFDEVKHSAILEQVGRLGLGRRSYNYIRDFLSERTVEIHAGDLQLPPKKLGSTGTPQGSTAVDAIEDHLDGKGLRCSPQKSELLIVPPPGKYRKREAEDSANIRIRTRDGAVIPRVDTLRVLGMYLEASRSNKTTVDRLVTKIGGGDGDRSGVDGPAMHHGDQ